MCFKSRVKKGVIDGKSGGDDSVDPKCVGWWEVKSGNLHDKHIQNSIEIWQWKMFENRPRLATVTIKNQVLLFQNDVPDGPINTIEHFSSCKNGRVCVNNLYDYNT